MKTKNEGFCPSSQLESRVQTWRSFVSCPSALRLSLRDSTFAAFLSGSPNRSNRFRGRDRETPFPLPVIRSRPMGGRPSDSMHVESYGSIGDRHIAHRVR